MEIGIEEYIINDKLTLTRDITSIVGTIATVTVTAIASVLAAVLAYMHAVNLGGLTYYALMSIQNLVYLFIGRNPLISTCNFILQRIVVRSFAGGVVGVVVAAALAVVFGIVILVLTGNTIRTSRSFEWILRLNSYNASQYTAQVRDRVVKSQRYLDNIRSNGIDDSEALGMLNLAVELSSTESTRKHALFMDQFERNVYPDGTDDGRTVNEAIQAREDVI